MKLNHYQQEAMSTAIYPHDTEIVYPALGLNGEAGEVAEKIKKVIRDKEGNFSNNDRHQIALELGDCLWYVCAIAKDIDYTLEEIARFNLAKLISRKERQKLQGSGDNR